MQRRPAVILFGGLSLLSRAPLFITEAARRGISVLSITAAAHSPTDRVGLRRADSTHPFSFIADVCVLADRDVTSGVRAARRWSEEYELVAAFSIGEVFVELAGVVADLFDLRSPGLRATRVCRDKYLQRSYLSDWSPHSRLVPPAERGRVAEMWDGDVPCVLKPTRRFSSSGVQAVASRGELAALALTYPDDEDLLVEELVVGPELSVESLSQDGSVIFECITGKRTTEANSRYFVETGHTIPHQLPEPVRRAVLATHRRILERLEFADGMAHGEYRVMSDGRVVLMEIAARCPGDGVLMLYHLATGAAVEPVLLDIMAGVPASYPAPTRLARQIYFEAPVGRLVDVTTSDPRVPVHWVCDRDVWPERAPRGRDDDGVVHAVLVLPERGAPVQPLASSFERVATALFDGRSEAELDALEAGLRAALDIHVAPA